VRARLVGAADQIIGDGVVIVRESEHVRRNRGDLLNRGIAGRCQHVWNTRTLCLGGEKFFGARPDQSGRAHWGNPDRRRVAASEQFHVGRRLPLNTVARQQLDLLERLDIAPDAMLLVGAPVDEIESEPRHSSAGTAAQVFDGGIELAQARGVRGQRTWTTEDRKEGLPPLIRCLSSVVCSPFSAFRQKTGGL